MKGLLWWGRVQRLHASADRRRALEDALAGLGDDSDGDISQQFISQLFSNPRALAMTAGILGILGLIPGMPNFIFITSAAGIGWLSWKLSTTALRLSLRLGVRSPASTVSSRSLIENFLTCSQRLRCLLSVST